MAEMVALAFNGFGGAAALAGGTSTALTVLQGVATAGSVLMGVAGAQQSALAGEAAALDARFNASLAEIDGQQQATASQAKALDLRREAIKRVGAARVAFGASGLDISSGQLSAIEGSIASDLEYGLALEKENENLARVGGQLKSLRYQSQAASSIAAGQAKAGGGYIGTGIKMAEGLLSIAKRG